MLRDDLGRGWPDGVAPDSGFVQISEKLPLRWLILAIFVFVRGVTLDDGGGNYAGVWYLVGLAALAAFAGDWIVWIGRNRQRKRQLLDDPAPLIQVLRDYGVEELGALYLYMPVPERSEDREARAWLRVMKAKQLVISGPWRLEACRAPPWLRKSHPRICSGDIIFYNVYRLKKDPLAAFV